MEWFAVVKQGMAAAISDYAIGIDGPFRRDSADPLTAVPWNNIVTTLMTNMSNLLSSKQTFNGIISSWDVSNVTSMYQTFYNSRAFNQPIGAWNTSAVTNMNQMFTSAQAFNQPIGAWNTSAVLDMTYMFAYASAFNQNISAWVVSQVTNYAEFRTGSALSIENTPARFR